MLDCRLLVVDHDLRLFRRQDRNVLLLGSVAAETAAALWKISDRFITTGWICEISNRRAFPPLLLALVLVGVRGRLLAMVEFLCSALWSPFEQLRPRAESVG